MLLVFTKLRMRLVWCQRGCHWYLFITRPFALIKNGDEVVMKSELASTKEAIDTACTICSSANDSQAELLTKMTVLFECLKWGNSVTCHEGANILDNNILSLQVSNCVHGCLEMARVHFNRAVFLWSFGRDVFPVSGVVGWDSLSESPPALLCAWPPEEVAGDDPPINGGPRSGTEIRVWKNTWPVAILRTILHNDWAKIAYNCI